MCKAENVTSSMQRINTECGYDIITCDSCNNKICPACDNIGDCESLSQPPGL